MKNLSKLEGVNYTAKQPEELLESLEYEGLILNLGLDQFIEGETRQASVTRTIRFFTVELPARIVSTIQSRPTFYHRLASCLHRRKTMTSHLTTIDPNGQVQWLIEEEEFVYFDEQVLELLIELVREEINQEVKQIALKRRQILVLFELDEEARRRLLRRLQMTCWQEVATSFPRPQSRAMPMWTSF